MALPNSNITTTMVGQELGVSTRNVGNLCRSEAINKWSKRKPFRDNVLSQTEPYWWRRSNFSPDLRAGFLISSTPNTVWQYMKPAGGENSPYRLGDFRGYSHGAYPLINLVFPNKFDLERDYEASFVFTGYENGQVAEEDDVGTVGLQDIFDIENKYVCLMVRFQSATQTVIAYSDKIEWNPYSVIFGTNIIIPNDDLILLMGQGGTITMEISIIEAVDRIGGNFVEPLYYSIRATENTITRHLNNQFRAIGYVVNTNFDTQEPSRNGGTITSSGYEQISFSASMRTGGSVTGYSFRARIIGNQVGDNFIYPISNFNLSPDQTELISIPNFTLQMLNPSGECEVELAVMQGTEVITSYTHNLTNY